MGLTVRIKGYEGAYDCGYITFDNFRYKLAKAKFGEKFGDAYYCWQHGFAYYDSDILDSHDSDPIAMLLFHSDCDGKFTPKECRTIYESIKDLHMDMEGHNYGDMKPYNMLERWKDMFLYCAKHRVNMYFM